MTSPRPERTPAPLRTAGATRLGPRRRRAWASALVWGAVAAALVALGRQAGVLGGVAGVALALALVVAVPTAREVAPRLFLNLLLILGWAQCLWWVPLGPEPWHATAALAAASGGLAAWLARDPGRRAALLLPRVRPADAAPLAIAGALGVLYAPFLRVTGGRDALAVLQSGWDNVNHFTMVREMLAFGVVGDLVPPNAHGAVPAFSDYPQSFHATVATLIELWAPQAAQRLDVQLALYQQLRVGVPLLVGVALALGVAALPRVRRRPLQAALLGIISVSSLTVGVGAGLVWSGFGNFLYASALIAAAGIAAQFPRALGRPAVAAAAGGAVLAVTHGWILLAPIAAAALVPALRRGSLRAASRPARMAVAAVVAASVLGSARAVPILLRSQSEAPLTTSVPIAATPPWWALTVAGLFAVATLVPWRGRVPWRQLPVLLVAGALVAGLIAFQLAQTGEVSYYAEKLWTGAEIALVGLLGPALARFVRPRPAAGAARVAWGLATAAACVAASQAQGVVALAPVAGLPPGTRVSVATTFSTRVPNEIKALGGPADHLAAAALVQSRDPERFYLLVDPPRLGGPKDAILANIWLRTLTNTQGKTTSETHFFGLTEYLKPGVPLAGYVREALAKNPDAVVLVPPQELGGVRDDLGGPLASHVATWDAPSPDDLARTASLWATVR